MIIASIDIGTNTVLLLIADADETTHLISPIINEYRMPRLGKGLIPGNNIKEDRITALFKILDEYREIINNHKSENILLTATNAFRIAGNSSQIVNEIAKKYNWKVNIISGEEEAKFAYLGALSGTKKEKEGLVIDIGGGSTELIFGTGKKILFRKSFQTGSVHSTEKFLKSNPPEDEQIIKLTKFLQNTFAEIKLLDAAKFAIAVSGTPTTLACMIKGIKDYDDDVIEESKLTNIELSQLIDNIKNLSPSQIADEYGPVMKGREDIILAGALILLNIMNLVNLSEVIVSSRGVRYGAVISYLEAAVQK